MTAAAQELVPHREALDLLFAVLRSPVVPGRDLGGARRVYPAAGPWHWQVPGDRGAGERVDDPVETVWLDARWALVERVFYAHALLGPHLREEGRGPRPAEGWEWSCVGLHRLFAAWGAPDGLVRADLRPALLSSGPEDEPDQERPCSVLYPRDRLEALAARLATAIEPRARRGRGRWRGGLAACALRHRLGPRDGPEALLERLGRESLARRAGRWVELAGLGGARARVRTSTFRHAAVEALARLAGR